MKGIDSGFVWASHRWETDTDCGHIKGTFFFFFKEKCGEEKKKHLKKSEGTTLRIYARFQWSRANESSASITAQIKIKQNRKLIVKGHKAQLCLLKQDTRTKKKKNVQLILSRINLGMNI